MDERTEPVPDEPGSEPAQTDPADRAVYRGPFRQPGLGTRIADYERRGTEDFLAGEYRALTPAAVCPTCSTTPGRTTRLPRPSERICRAGCEKGAAP